LKDGIVELERACMLRVVSFSARDQFGC